MYGRLIAIVGPSGSGKDTLISGLQSQIKAHFPARFITRQSFPNDEKYTPVSKKEFQHLIDTNQLAFYWSAHNLSYGIPITINQFLSKGKDVIFNCSRVALNEISQKYTNLEIIIITAPPEILKMRLIARGRETTGEIASRVNRNVDTKLTGAITVDNSKSIEEGLINLIKAINQSAKTFQ